MLALVGSGEYLPPIEPLDRELISRLPGPARWCACPPRPARRAPSGSPIGRAWGWITSPGSERRLKAVPVIDRASADDPTLAAAIAGANFIYLSGGKPDYLYRTLAGSLAWEAIQTVLAGGGLLAGCSAGAMILGEKFFGFPGWKPGFNFLPGATVLPHFDEIPLTMIRSLRALTGKDTILLGIEGNTALVGSGKQYEVVGSGGVTVWSRASKTRYTRGPLPYWGEGR